LKARFVQPQRRFIEKDPRAAERSIIAALVQRAVTMRLARVPSSLGLATNRSAARRAGILVA
jgi:hypothetical protein